MTPIATQILTSIITGGFVLVFNEIGHRMRDNEESYCIEMKPYLHKLAAYLRFVSLFKTCIPFRNRESDSENFKAFKNHLQYISKQCNCIINGEDVGLHEFNADRLELLNGHINEVWRMYGKLSTDDKVWKFFTHQSEISYLRNELVQIDPQYITKEISQNTLADVSGDFYVKEFVPIQDFPYLYEVAAKIYKWHIYLSGLGILCTLALLCIAMFECIGLYTLNILTLLVTCHFALCLVLLAIPYYTQNYLVESLKSLLKKLKIPLMKHRKRNKETQL